MKKEEDNKLATGAAQEQMPESKKAKFMARHKETHPDLNYESEDDFYGALSDDYDNYEGEINRYKEDEERIASAMRSNPSAAMYFKNILNGSGMDEEAVRAFGLEIADAIDDPDRMEALIKANQDHLERVAKSKQLDEEYDRNLQESIDAIENAEDLSEEEVAAGMAMFKQIMDDGIVGKITPETIKALAKAANYDNDMGVAREEGRIAGRNEKIDERSRKRKTSGDGLPQSLGSTAKNNVSQKKPKQAPTSEYEETYKDFEYLD